MSDMLLVLGGGGFSSPDQSRLSFDPEMLDEMYKLHSTLSFNNVDNLPNQGCVSLAPYYSSNHTLQEILGCRLTGLF